MPVTVNIMMPDIITSMPYPVSASASDPAVAIEAAWYHVDGGDAVAFDFVPSALVHLTLSLEGLASGNHILSVYARTAGDLNFDDKHFSVNLPTVVPTPTGPLIPGSPPSPGMP